MIRALALTTLLLPAAAFAQTSPGMSHEHSMHGGPMMGGHEMMAHGQAKAPTQPGQEAFAAIQEIVGILDADPATDWSKVNIDALRQHLIDMNNVTLSAEVTNEPVDGGVRFFATGAGPVRDSIRRMIPAHAATMNGVGGWTFEAAEIENGESLTVHAPDKDIGKLKGLGFLGVMTLGMHHQQHHLMIARGEHPHH